MKLALIAFLGASTAWAADGTVHNATKNKPQAGATVSLFRMTQNGPEMLASVKSAADGSFNLAAPGGDAPGPKMVQTVYGGVTYSHVMPPGTPTTNLQVEVYDSSGKVPDAKVSTHMMLLEPVNGQIGVSESFIYTNPGKVTYNDPDHGTLRFYIPPEAAGKMEVNVLAPNSVAVRRSADKTGVPNVYKLDFPIRPGESRIDLTYLMPFTSPGTFTSKVLFKDPDTKVLAPVGVTLSGAGLKELGKEPQSQATIYDLAGADLKVAVQGSGALARAGSNGQSDADGGGAGAGGGDQDGALAELLPQLYNKTSPAGGIVPIFDSVKWILLVVFAMLAAGFAYLYRRSAPSISTSDSAATPAATPASMPKAANERRG
jgi:hypothetical protein